VSARSYLSIGDVLTLLRQEFPDVTISKIRFLESQGLVNPERTPSGYRKFYEHDVERLRWVLRQQREHFLPLKVIKDRLDEDERGTPAAAAASAADLSPEQAEPAAAPVGEDVPAATAAPAAPGEGAVAEEAPILVAATSEPSATARHRAPEHAIVGAAAGTGTAAAAGPVRTHRPAPSAEPSVANGRGNGSAGHDEPAAGPVAGPPTTPPEASPPAPAPKAPRAPRAAKAATTRPAPTTDGSADDVPVTLASHGGASLSVEDLCAASGLTAEDVVQLQEYGLLSATVAGGVEFFDEEALTVANLAAKFAGFGIEARHLRLYKNAAEREAGFIEQIVIPMVRQRNPEARARATQTAEDLTRLGQQLRGSLLRSALRDLLSR
jgi:DNA-binding transcriptional MerR regulator